MMSSKLQFVNSLAAPLLLLFAVVFIVLQTLTTHSAIKRNELDCLRNPEQCGISPEVTIDCYGDIDLSEPMPLPQLDTSDVLGTFSKCGHPPQLISARVVPIEDDHLPIPNIVHFVGFSADGKDNAFTFRQYLAVLSASKFLKPRYIFWHANVMPQGDWWRRLAVEVTNFYFVRWRFPSHVSKWPVRLTSLATDITRLRILALHGGIYLDDDMLVLKSMTPLRNRTCVMTQQLRRTLVNCVILSAPNSVFLRMWLESYKGVTTDQWAMHSMQTPSKLMVLYPYVVHLEKTSLAYPTWPNVAKMFTGRWDRNKSYSVHIQAQKQIKGKLPNAKEEMDQSNTTVGEIMRYVYYH